MSIYEQILNEDSTDAEAYWSLVLCRYGIEYVEDPSSHKRIPTVNRAQYTSIYMDEDYKSAIANADIYQKSIYEEEAKAIDEIQKGILEISSKEEPFDVFICYKETDNNGRRTPDSVLANDLYHQLVQEGFKVFFSRITLEDKLGSAYEPYIFAALNSAKVMVVLGTKSEYFNAVWVKNEWSRFLSLIRSGKKKMLIPAYRDMDPYDLPEEFSHLQAQDMTKLGFMQDLIRGIKKILDADAPKETVKETVVVSNTANSNTAPLLKRAFMFLEDGEWEKADEFCEQVLNINPEEPRAYLGKLMAELKIKKEDKLKDSALPFDESNNYQKAYRFADDTMKAKLESDIKFINDRNENARKQSIYDEAKALVKDDIQFLNESISFFSQISGWKDADMQIENCKKKIEEVKEKIEIARKDDIYSRAYNKSRDSIAAVEQAIELYKQIPGWKDADNQLELANTKLAELNAKKEEERIAAAKARKKAMKITAVVGPIVAAMVVFLVVLVNVIIPNSKYNLAMEFFEQGKYEEAIIAFSELGEYKESDKKIEEIKRTQEEKEKEEKYNSAMELYEQDKYEEAIAVFTELGGFKDSASKLDEIKHMPSYIKTTIEKANVGDTIIFGRYGRYGNNDLDWQILDKQDNMCFVISKRAVTNKKYNEERRGVTWETCTLRGWLNGKFLTSAFTDDERKIIKETAVKNDANPEYGTTGGNDTQDKIFLLSIDEAEKYFKNDEERKCKMIDSDDTCRWWLRSPGTLSYCAAVVDTRGFVDYNGYTVDSDLEVRPALWINLES